MSIRLIRQESQTPNVTNHDDARMVRYAYGGFDGFVKDRGSEIGYAIDGTSFVVQSGVLVLQGWEVEIDANGASISVPPNVSTLQYFSVYLEVNCGTDAATIKSTYQSGTYPDIPASDNLTANTVGVARLLLYQFTVTNGVISNVKKVVQRIEYSLYNISELRDGLQNGTIIPANAKSINSLEIKRDENGVLKIGDTIIPQRRLLYGDLQKLEVPISLPSDGSLVAFPIEWAQYKDKTIEIVARHADSNSSGRSVSVDHHVKITLHHNEMNLTYDLINTEFFAIRTQTNVDGFYFKRGSGTVADDSNSIVAIYEIIQ